MKRNLLRGFLFVVSGIFLVYYFYFFFWEWNRIISMLFGYKLSVSSWNIKTKSEVVNKLDKRINSKIERKIKLETSWDDEKKLLDKTLSWNVFTWKILTWQTSIDQIDILENETKEIILYEDYLLNGECDVILSGNVKELEYFSGLSFTGVVCKTGSIVFFSSYNFSCPEIEEYLLSGWMNLFVDKKLLKKNKFIGEKVCFLNFNNNKVYRWIKYQDKWHWFVVPKKYYYKLKLKLWDFYKDK